MEVGTVLLSESRGVLAAEAAGAARSERNDLPTCSVGRYFGLLAEMVSYH